MRVGDRFRRACAASTAAAVGVLLLAGTAAAARSTAWPSRPEPAAGPRPAVQTVQGAIARARASASGVAMPLGNLPGWRQVFADDFATPAARGTFIRSGYAKRWSTYPDGTPDTAGQRGYPSMYAPTQVLSVSHGVLDLYLHSRGGKALGAALSPILPGHVNGFTGQRYGRYEVRFRTDAVYGYKTAWLLWPDSGIWPQGGEIDFPEGALTANIAGVMHRQNAVRGTDQSIFRTRTATASGWHTATIEWQPNLLTLTLDGKVIGRATYRVPSTPMHWVLQTEACQGGPAGNRCPTATTAGHLQIDWAVAYTRA